MSPVTVGKESRCLDWQFWVMCPTPSLEGGGPRTGEGQLLKKRKWLGPEEKKRHDRQAKPVAFHYNYMSLYPHFLVEGTETFVRLSSESYILHCRLEVQTQVWLPMTLDYLLSSVDCCTFLLLEVWQKCSMSFWMFKLKMRFIALLSI